MTDKQIKKLFKTAKDKNIAIRMRDVAYVLLSDIVTPANAAYLLVFGAECQNIDAYDDSEPVVFIKDYVKYYDMESSIKKGERSRKMSFDENKNAMIELLKQTQEAMDNGEMEKKDGLKIMADIRVKLNDKFNVNDTSQNSIVIVESKFNSICEWCGHEIYVPTKEDMMEKYDLVEREG